MGISNDRQKRRHSLNFVCYVGGATALILLFIIFSQGFSQESVILNVIKIESDNIGKTGWSKENHLYQEECQFWYNKSIEWGEVLRKNRPASSTAILANQDYSGLGDRVSGLVAVLSRAFHYKLPFKIRWKNLPLGFELTEYIIQDNSTYYAKMIDSSKSMYRKKCKDKEYYHCQTYQENESECPLYLRACVGRRQCFDLKESLIASDIQPSMKHVIGCPLRTLMHPSNELLSHEVNVFFLGSQYTLSLATLLEYLQRFRVISVHLRMGDYAFLKGLDDEKLLPIKMSSIRCLDIVESEIKWDRRPIVWFLASDDYKLKQFFMARFPKKTITLTRKAHHMAYVTKQAPAERALETKDLFSDWMLIGRGQQLITNHAHNFGVSSFSRLSWLYHLKDEYYEIDSSSSNDKAACKRKMFEYDGNLGQLDQSCQFGS